MAYIEKIVDTLPQQLRALIEMRLLVGVLKYSPGVSIVIVQLQGSRYCNEILNSKQLCMLHSCLRNLLHAHKWRHLFVLQCFNEQWQARYSLLS